MDPSIGSVLLIFVGAPIAVVGIVTLLVVTLTSPSRHVPEVGVDSSEGDAPVGVAGDAPNGGLDAAKPATQPEEEPENGGAAPQA